MAKHETSLAMWATQDRLLAEMWRMVLDAKGYETPPDTPDHFLRCDLHELYERAKAALYAAPYRHTDALAAVAAFLECVRNEMRANAERE